MPCLCQRPEQLKAERFDKSIKQEGKAKVFRHICFNCTAQPSAVTMAPKFKPAFTSLLWGWPQRCSLLSVAPYLCWNDDSNIKMTAEMIDFESRNCLLGNCYTLSKYTSAFYFVAFSALSLLAHRCGGHAPFYLV